MRERFQCEPFALRDVARSSQGDAHEGITEQLRKRIDLGYKAYLLGQYEEASRQMEAIHAEGEAEGVEASEGSPKYSLLKAELLGILADCQANLGYFDQTQYLLDAAIARLAGLGSDDLAIHIRYSLLDRKALYLGWSGRHEAATIASEELLKESRKLAAYRRGFLPDLARILDHRAEILEGAGIGRAALIAANESTELLRRRFLTDQVGAPAFLHSLVTLARLNARFGDPQTGILQCKEAASLMFSAVPDGEMAGLVASCHGANLAAAGQVEEAANQYLTALNVFRDLARQEVAALIHQEAIADVSGDLAVLLAPSNWPKARHEAMISLGLRHRLARRQANPMNLGRLAEALVSFGQLQLTHGLPQEALRCFQRAIKIYQTLDPLPGNFPEHAVKLSVAVIALATAGEIGLARLFRGISSALARSIDYRDPRYLTHVQGHIDTFQSLWLTNALQRGDGVSLIVLLSFAHARRLALLLLADIHARDEGFQRYSTEEQELRKLQCQIRRLDLEVDEVIGPSVSDDEEPAARDIKPGPLGRAVEGLRRRLFQRYITLRDAATVGTGPNRRQRGFLHLMGILRKVAAKRKSAHALWCDPKAFGLDLPPRMILVFGRSDIEILSIDEFEPTHAAFQRLIDGWRTGRTRMRDGGVSSPSAMPSPRVIQEEAALQRGMASIWGRIEAMLAQRGILRLDMVTHARAHGLPWLGFCPVGIGLRQFPAINLLLRRPESRLRQTPTPDRPLVLVIDDGWESEPHTRLYHARLEAAAIRRLWPAGAVVVAQDLPPHCHDIAGLWVIGHGFADSQGRPLLGLPNRSRPLETLNLLRQPERRIGLIYASTCYLGQTADILSEPVGLPSLAALRPEAPYAAGAVAPVDDLGASLLALLFHVYWRRTGQPRLAFDRARAALQGGGWPRAAKWILGSLCREELPELMQQARADAAISRADVGRWYPDLSSREELARQHLIRSQGQECLETWQAEAPGAEKSAGVRLLRRLYRNGTPCVSEARILATARYWSWFG